MSAPLSLHSGPPPMALTVLYSEYGILTVTRDVVFTSPEDNVFSPTAASCVSTSDTCAKAHYWRNKYVLKSLVGLHETPLLLWSSCAVISGLTSRTFPKQQQPHGIQEDRFVQTGAVTAAGAGTRALSERFDTLSHSPLSLALVSKQYGSLNCSVAYACCHTCAS